MFEAVRFGVIGRDDVGKEGHDDHQNDDDGTACAQRLAPDHPADMVDDPDPFEAGIRFGTCIHGGHVLHLP